MVLMVLSTACAVQMGTTSAHQRCRQRQRAVHASFFFATTTRTLKVPQKNTLSQVNCLKITPDKQFLAAAGNPHVRLFEINSQNASALVSYDGHTTNVTDVGEFSFRHTTAVPTLP